MLGKIYDLPIALPQLNGAHTGEAIAIAVVATLRRFPSHDKRRVTNVKLAPTARKAGNGCVPRAALTVHLGDGWFFLSTQRGGESLLLESGADMSL